VPEREAPRDRLVRWSHLARQLLARPVRFAGGGPLELHTLVGHQTLPLYLIAARSFHRHLPEARMAVHDDGTLSRLDRLVLRAAVRGARLIPAATADAIVAERLAPWPTVLRCRRENVRLRQLIDYSLLASTTASLWRERSQGIATYPAATATSDCPKPSSQAVPITCPPGAFWEPA